MWTRTPTQNSDLTSRPLSNLSSQCCSIQKALSCQILVNIAITDSPHERAGTPRARKVLEWEVSIVGSWVKAAAGGHDILLRSQTHFRKIPARCRAQSLSNSDSKWSPCDLPQLQTTPPTPTKYNRCALNPGRVSYGSQRIMCDLLECQMPSKKHGCRSNTEGYCATKNIHLTAPVGAAFSGPGPSPRVSPSVLVSFCCCDGTL